MVIYIQGLEFKACKRRDRETVIFFREEVMMREIRRLLLQQTVMGGFCARQYAELEVWVDGCLLRGCG